MKKFLSLLLALTMVMSLVVVPARAHDDEVTLNAGKSVIEINEQTTILASLSSGEYASGYPKWTVDDNTKATLSASDGATTATVTGKAATTGDGVTITCTYKLNADASQEQTAVLKIKVNAPDCTHAVKSITVNGIKTGVTASGAANTADYYTVTGQTITAADFTTANIEFKTGFSKGDGTITLEDNTLSIPVTTGGEHPTTGTTTITLTPKVVAVPTVAIEPVDAKRFEGQNLKFTATAANAPEGASYIWTYGNANSTAEASTPLTSARTSAVTVSAPSHGNYKVFCKVAFGSVATAASAGNDFTTLADPYEPDYNAKDSTKSATLSPSTNAGLAVNKTWQIPMPRLKNTTSGSTESLVPGTDAGCTVKFTSNDRAIASVDETSGLVTAGTKAGVATISATISYNGKAYAKVLTYTVVNRVLEATLSAVQNNTALTLDGRSYYGNLSAAAQTALTSNGIKGTVSSVTLTPGQVTNGYIQQTSTANYYTFTGTTIGVATFTGTVTTVNPNGTYTVTFKIPVTPINTTYADQYPEPVAAYGNTYRYAVQVPSGYTSYYVVAKNAPAAPTDWSSKIDNATHTSASPYYLYDNDFVNGKCVLHVVTYTSSTTYPYTANVAYCGTITVYQKNYNINYNGVAGETVQFKHADFTNFMNEIAQARGDSSKNNYNNSYVTFNDVTFSMPSSAQGTLYYNGTAMSNSNSSSAFNRSTKVTNLDNITFVPNAKTSAKSITLNFTLHATKYTSYGNTRGTAVNYPGSVVISIVREDIKYTVAPGDSISFTSSDFQNFLRTQSGINYNHNVDYVTFDQSAVNSLNEGVLYNGYSGFSAVKATDKFYYTTTNSYTQNALSDVTFRASTYAKAGTTVYVPFTIYAKLGTSNVISKQVEGTVAIKIAQTMNFADVKPTDYFYNPVKWAVNKNITKGTSATTFSPYKTCTRAEIVTFLWRDAGSPMPTTSRHPFTDVSYSMGSDFYNAILWANQNGITAGTTTTTFSPNKTCTRAEIVTFLWRYAKKPVGYGSNSFTDVNKNDHAPYYDAILWAVSKGITTGSTNTTFSPNGTCTRGEAVTFLYRFEGGK